MCGGTPGQGSVQKPSVGLSPRVRGNPGGRGRRGGAGRSIPACAGEPMSLSFGWRWRGVYPRVCGGTPSVLAPFRYSQGLSPRVRGNHWHSLEWQGCSRSIPACAGEPPAASSKPHRRPVYPRVCGGTPAGTSGCWPARGLSPRVRGNPQARPREGQGAGSIPACAGEPTTSEPGRTRAMVYPRVCGGTSPAFRFDDARHGLSPRVRGNLWRR